MRLAILQQSYGRFGGAERLALYHFMQVRRMNVDVTLYYKGAVSPGWAKRLEGYDVRPTPQSLGNHSDLVGVDPA